MSLDCRETSRLETLPMEILSIIVDLLPFWGVKDLSRASRRLRKACIPSLFNHVKFQFSETGFEGLKSLLYSNIRNHVVSFTYVVPELLKAGKYLYYRTRPALILFKSCVDILDFNHFKSDI
jgi:hypothetical protein